MSCGLYDLYIKMRMFGIIMRAFMYAGLLSCSSSLTAWVEWNTDQWHCPVSCARAPSAGRTLLTWALCLRRSSRSLWGRCTEGTCPHWWDSHTCIAPHSLIWFDCQIAGRVHNPVSCTVCASSEPGPASAYGHHKQQHAGGTAGSGGPRWGGQPATIGTGQGEHTPTLIPTLPYSLITGSY